jgi:hypothetical protein
VDLHSVALNGGFSPYAHPSVITDLFNITLIFAKSTDGLGTGSQLEEDPMKLQQLMIILALLLGGAPSGLSEEKSTRFEMVGAISQKVGRSDVGIVLLKDKKTNRTVPVQIGKIFKLGDEIFHVIKLTTTGAIISNGTSLESVGKSTATASFEGSPLIQGREMDDRVPAKFRPANKRPQVFKRAEMVKKKAPGDGSTTTLKDQLMQDDDTPVVNPEDSSTLDFTDREDSDESEDVTE